MFNAFAWNGRAWNGGPVTRKPLQLALTSAATIKPGTPDPLRTIVVVMLGSGLTSTVKTKSGTPDLSHTVVSTTRPGSP